jgi:alcohol dehydrogenase YqhD (iron-dependent ADH family)
MSEQIFSIRCPTHIQFGAGSAVASLSAIAELGRRALLIHGASPGRAQWLVDGLTEQGLALSFASCPREPDIELIEACVEVGRGADVELVIGVGGGAVIDTAKAVAGLIPAQGQVMDYLEVVGGGQPLEAHPLPWVALPTTAGTGAEVTRNAVIDVPRSRRKVSLRDDRLLPTLAIVDPDLTVFIGRDVAVGIEDGGDGLIAHVADSDTEPVAVIVVLDVPEEVEIRLDPFQGLFVVVWLACFDGISGLLHLFLLPLALVEPFPVLGQYLLGIACHGEGFEDRYLNLLPCRDKRIS